MTTLKLGAHMSISGGVSQALDRAASIGCNAVQVFTKNNRQWSGPPIDAEDVARWQAKIREFNIESTVSHASYLINLASPKPETRQKSIQAYQDELARAHAYGIPYVVLHPGSHTGSGEETGLRQIAVALDHIHQEMAHATKVLTLLELTAGQGTNLGYEFTHLRRIMEQVAEPDRLGVCVDTCHAFAAGYDLRSVEGYQRLIDDLEREVGMERLKCWHLNDSKGELGSRKDRHAHIGEGNIGIDGFRWVLNDPRWVDVPMLLETPKGKDLKEDVMNLKRLCAVVDDPARIPPGLRIER
ncbi:MAG: deoxyribonuclease IV [Gemmatimonadetes bacterium]|nr:MAG: deoxyribonuclease IV [Gemmatimonadota bacterium]